MPLLEDLFAQDLLLESLEDGLRFDLALDFPFREVRNQVLEHLIDRAIALQLVPDAHGLAERDEHLFLYLAVERVVYFLLRRRALRLAGFFGECINRGDDPLDGGVAGLEAKHHVLLRELLDAGLDHHDRVLTARDDQVERARLALLVRRVDHVLATHFADAHAGNRLLERDARERERG